MELSTEDIRRTDINFENIYYSVSVPKQKGEWINAVIDDCTVITAINFHVYDVLIDANCLRLGGLHLIQLITKPTMNRLNKFPTMNEWISHQWSAEPSASDVVKLDRASLIDHENGFKSSSGDIFYFNFMVNKHQWNLNDVVHGIATACLACNYT